MADGTAVVVHGAHTLNMHKLVFLHYNMQMWMGPVIDDLVLEQVLHR
jgi:hypothetical protein